MSAIIENGGGEWSRRKRRKRKLTRRIMVWKRMRRNYKGKRQINRRKMTNENILKKKMKEGSKEDEEGIT